MARNKILFLVFFAIIFVIGFYIYSFLLNQVSIFIDRVFTSGIGTYLYLMLMLVLFLSLIAVSAYFAEHMEKFSICKGLDSPKKVTVFIVLIVVAFFTGFQVKTAYEYREQTLSDIIHFPTENIAYVHIDMEDFTSVVQEEDVSKLNELLSKYRVRKMKDDEWDSDVSRDRGHSVMIASNNRRVIALILENRVGYLNDGNYYKVLNGPIDMDWFEKLVGE